MDFSAIDFETATSSRNSACSVAVVDVKDNIIIDKYYTLLKPPGLKFNWFNIKIHGIHPDDVQDAPTFKDIWPDLRKHLEGHYRGSRACCCLYSGKLVRGFDYQYTDISVLLSDLCERQMEQFR